MKINKYKIGDIIITNEGHIGTIAYKVDGIKSFEKRWRIYFPSLETATEIGDFNESEFNIWKINYDKAF